MKNGQGLHLADGRSLVFQELADGFRSTNGIVEIFDRLVTASTDYTSATEGGFVLADADGASLSITPLKSLDSDPRDSGTRLQDLALEVIQPTAT